MAKKKQQQSAPKKQRKQKSKPRRPKQMGTMDPTLMHAICSNINPFCPEAQGAKLYDDNSAPSAVFQCRQLFNVTTDANGIAAIYLTANPSAALYQGTVVASAVTGWGVATTNNFYTSYAGNCDTYRVVSWGFRYRTTLPWTTATGNLIVVQDSERNMSSFTGQSIQSVSQGLAADYTPLRDASIECVGKPAGMSSLAYINIGATMPGYSTFNLYISGAPASSVVGTIEVVVNYEWQAIPGGLGQFSSKAAPSVPDVLTIRSKAASDRPLMDRFVDTITSDHSWMGTVANNMRSAAYLAGTVASFTPYGRTAKMLMGAASAVPRILD